MSVLKDSDIEIVVVKKGIENNRLRVEKGANLYEVLKKNKLLGDYPCAGKGICGKCKVKITSGAPASTPDDERHLTREELEEGVRLACRTSNRTHGANH
jgi:Na+-transporting NADH:ubiquinone oxidoreductase subunit NqrF